MSSLTRVQFDKDGNYFDNNGKYFFPILPHREAREKEEEIDLASLNVEDEAKPNDREDNRLKCPISFDLLQDCIAAKCNQCKIIIKTEELIRLYLKNNELCCPICRKNLNEKELIDENLLKKMQLKEKILLVSFLIFVSNFLINITCLYLDCYIQIPIYQDNITNIIAGSFTLSILQLSITLSWFFKTYKTDRELLLDFLK